MRGRERKAALAATSSRGHRVRGEYRANNPIRSILHATSFFHTQLKYLPFFRTAALTILPE